MMTRPRIVTIPVFPELKQQAYYMDYIEARHPWTFYPHTHDAFCDLTYVMEGELQQTVNDACFRLRAGTLIWIRASDWHTIGGIAFRYANINVREADVRSLAALMHAEQTFNRLQRQPSPPVIEVPVAKRPSLISDMKEVFTGQRTDRARILLYKFLSTVFCDYFSLLGSGQPDLPGWLTDLLVYIEEHIEAGLTMDALARACDRSYPHLSRTFTRYMQVPLSHYLNGKRIERAALLLANTNRPILDICYRLGFNNPSYFYRLFKQRHKLSPRKYRLKHNPHLKAS